jgi:hypothetical protein
MSLEIYCAFDHAPSRMQAAKGQGFIQSFSCPACRNTVDVIGNGLYCGRCGDRMKRIVATTFCPTCKYEVRVPEHIRVSVHGLYNVKAPPKPAQPKPVAAAPAQAPSAAPALDQGVLDAIGRLLEARGQVELSVVRNLIKARLKQEADPGPYVRRLVEAGKAKLEGEKLVKAA